MTDRAEVATTQLPRIACAPLWHMDFYDIPLDGIALTEDRLVYYRIADDESEWLLYELTDAEAREVVTRHFMFEAIVGLHTCAHVKFHGNARPRFTSPEGWHDFYDMEKERTKLDLAYGKEPFGVLVVGSGQGMAP